MPPIAMLTTVVAAPMAWMPATGLMSAALASVFAWLSAFAAAVAPAAVAALWQGSAVAVVLALGFRFAPRIHIHLGAAQRFAVWATAFAAIAALPFLPLFAHGSTPPTAFSAMAGSPSAAPWFQVDFRWASGLAVLWLAVSLARAVGLAVHSARLCRIYRSAAPAAADERLGALLAAASPARPIELCTTRDLDRPSVIGFFRPRILIPDWLLSRLTPGELEHVVLHEAEHLRRRDDWTNLLQKLALVLFPLNPALIWIERRLCREREMACDEGVVRRTRAPRAYAASLANLAGHALDRRRAHALSLGAFERRPELARRVISLLACKPALHPAAARALVGLAACGLLVASVELARCPQLVAFVPAAPTATLQNQSARMNFPPPQIAGDSVYDEPAAASGFSGLRAMPAKAILNMPGEDSMHRSHGAAAASKAPRSTVAENSRAKAAPLLRDPLSSRSSAISFASAGNSGGQRAASNSVFEERVTSAAGPGVVVFTAWQEIETSPRLAGSIADYNTGAANASDSEGAPEYPASRLPSLRITVTRLIFWVAPRSGAALPNAYAPNSKQPRPRTSDLRQPFAPQFESGWLVFEL